MSRQPNEYTPDAQWLRDCGWGGWLEDAFNGRMTTHHGDTFASSTALRRWLESLPAWPRVRNVPKKTKPTP